MDTYYSIYFKCGNTISVPVADKESVSEALYKETYGAIYILYTGVHRCININMTLNEYIALKNQHREASRVNFI